MKWLIKLLGGYTKEEVLGFNEEFKKKIDKANNDYQKARSDCSELSSRLNVAKYTIKALQEDVDDLTNELKAEKDKNPIVNQDTRYMFIDPSQTVYEEKGKLIINAQSDMMSKDNSLRVVYNRLWAIDSDKKVTIEEFNDGFTALYRNRFNVDIVDEYLKNQLIQVKYKMLAIDINDDTKYVYNKHHVLAYENGYPVVK